MQIPRSVSKTGPRLGLLVVFIIIAVFGTIPSAPAPVGAYPLFTTGSVATTTPPTGQLSIDNGHAITKNPLLSITIANVTGEPTKMRVSLDTPLTDATPLEAYRQTFTRSVSDPNLCTHTVYVQLISDVTGLTSDVLTSSIVVDSQVQAEVIARNPYKRENAVVFSQSQQVQPLVTDGDANYTRVMAFYIEVNGSAECSSLQTVRAGRSTSSLPLAYSLSSDVFVNVLPIPGQVVVGSNALVFQVEDGVGNTQFYTREISYDPTPPTLVTTGTLGVDVHASRGTILANLAVAGNEVTDNMYPGRGFWGVWVANSRTSVADPATDTTLAWQVMPISGTASNFTLANWSLVGGLPRAQQTPGDYYVYLRFLDGAGNPTAGYLSAKVTLTDITPPTVFLPVTLRR